MTHRWLDSCLKDLHEQAEIGYDSITVHEGDWRRWEKEITEELDKIEGYTTINKAITGDLLVVAETNWRQE